LPEATAGRRQNDREWLVATGSAGRARAAANPCLTCNTPQYKQSRRDRKKVEMLFAHLKRILKLDRLRLRGLTGANDEFLLAATAQNLRRMAKRLFEGQQSTVAMTA
jgi:Transposase DDE domain